MPQYPIEEALRAQQALRAAANLPPELFPLQAFVGMISDEIEQLRARGLTDQQIANLVQQNSSIRITAQQIADHYASPGQRRHP